MRGEGRGERGRDPGQLFLGPQPRLLHCMSHDAVDHLSPHCMSQTQLTHPGAKDAVLSRKTMKSANQQPPKMALFTPKINRFPFLLRRREPSELLSPPSNVQQKIPIRPQKDATLMFLVPASPTPLASNQTAKDAPRAFKRK